MLGKLLKSFSSGLVISLLGTLPFGTLNILAMNISVTESLERAIWFSLGVIVMESSFVYLSLLGVNFIQSKTNFLRGMKWFSVIILALLTISSFYGAIYPSEKASVIPFGSSLPRFQLGIFMAIINPAQLPFWLGWNSVLFSKGILINKQSIYLIYIIGTSLGTFLGLSIFMYGGHFGVGWIKLHQVIFQYMVAILFLITTLIQSYKIYQEK